MKLLSNIFSKGTNDKINSRLEFIKTEFKNGNNDIVILHGEKLIESVKRHDNIELLKMIGLAHFNKQQFKEALPYFEEIASKSANSDDWFNVVTSAILSNEVDKGMNAFSKAIDLYEKNGNENNLPIGQMSYYVMQAFRDTQEYDLAFVQMMKLKDVYCHLKITDTTFLHIRGLPFISHVLSAGKMILEKQSLKDSFEWLDDFASHLDDEGKQLVLDFKKTVKYSS